jgi:TonB family protein
MIKVYMLSILLLMAKFSQGQTKKINAGGIEIQLSAVDTSLNASFCEIGQGPEFPGGMANLIAFAKHKIKYPETAVNDNVQGSVILQFIIDKKGKVTGKQIFKSVRKDLDNVCIAMLNQMPNWKPAKLNGKTIAVNERWEIKFVLTD